MNQVIFRANINIPLILTPERNTTQKIQQAKKEALLDKIHIVLTNILVKDLNGYLCFI